MHKLSEEHRLQRRQLQSASLLSSSSSSQSSGIVVQDDERIVVAKRGDAHGNGDDDDDDDDADVRTPMISGTSTMPIMIYDGSISVTGGSGSNAAAAASSVIGGGAAVSGGGGGGNMDMNAAASSYHEQHLHPYHHPHHVALDMSMSRRVGAKNIHTAAAAAVDLQQNNNKEPGASRKQLMWLLSLAKFELPLIIIAAVSLTLSSGINLALPAYAGSLMNSITHNGADMLDNLVLGLFGLAVMTGVISFVRTYFITLAAERVVVRLRKSLFSNIIRQEIGFFDVSKTGELLNRLSSDTKALELAVTVNIESLCRHAMELFGCVIILIFTSVKLCMLMLLIVPFVAIGAVLYGRFVQGLSRRLQDALARASEVAEETLGNIRTVRALGQEAKQNAQYNRSIDTSFKCAKKLAVAGAANVGGTIFIGTMALVIVLWYGGRLVLSKEMSVGTLTSFLLYTLFVAYSLSQLSSVYFDLLKALGAAERIYALIHRTPAIDIENPQGEIPRELMGHIRLDNVYFSYPSRPDQLVLNGLSLDIQSGEVVALVGASGGGKSTVANLLLRFYDPDSGAVLIDDIDVRRLDSMWCRTHIAVVSQEPVLFATSIRENICYANPNATMDQIINAAREANAHDFIEQFRDGYDTMVGERGAQLSGGQKQRISIARALLQQPKILILDEATSALDSESEHLVKKALDRLMRGKTVVVIAHRLSTVKNADRVCVISKGRVVEQGTHSDLMQHNGIYRRLVERQLLPEDAVDLQ